MTVVAETTALMQLARSRAAGDRERLLSSIIDLCEGGGAAEAARSEPVQALLNSIFMTLVVEAERDIRKRLAEKLAAADWAPPALINILALDDIEVARPIIAGSPVLQDADLVRLLVETTLEHQIEVARRPRLGAPVVAAILDRGEPAVLTALAGNETAEVSAEDLRRLVQAARRIAALRSPLARHPGLSADLARELYQWIGQALRQTLVARFRLDAEALDAALSQAVADAHAGREPEAGTEAWTRQDEREVMEARLIGKLHAAGQLRPGYLLRALREHKLSMFMAALAALGPFDAAQLQRAVDSDRPELLALACAAVGVDRSAFPTILTLVRELNAGRPGGGAEGERRARGAFGPFSPEVAAAAFRQAVGAV